jgi:hypothetical protein
MKYRDLAFIDPLKKSEVLNLLHIHDSTPVTSPEKDEKSNGNTSDFYFIFMNL